MKTNLEKQVVERVYSGTKWEEEVAYCRALKVNGIIYVSGTTAVNERGEIQGKGNLYEQAMFVFMKIDKALKQLDSDLSKVIRTRMYVVNMDDFDALAKVHKQIFKEVFPVATCIQVSRLIHPELLVEIEVEAIIYENN